MLFVIDIDQTKTPGVGVYDTSIEKKKAVYKLSNYKS